MEIVALPTAPLALYCWLPVVEPLRLAFRATETAKAAEPATAGGALRLLLGADLTHRAQTKAENERQPPFRFQEFGIHRFLAITRLVLHVLKTKFLRVRYATFPDPMLPSPRAGGRGAGILLNSILSGLVWVGVLRDVWCCSGTCPATPAAPAAGRHFPDE